ncbi:unnamed protein product [Spirodela intermedia]|uniref:Uncharacterized protein n=1 Tax=Spirodela intermedia TaxID=51605 RepID=A0A7I8JK47_SPIIN|nr:unnamed protein product [Spirodela intermedia]CAA6670440.1 unnamed protein product [Spirodela intermedia]
MVLSKTASEFDVSVHSSFASRYVRTSLPRFRMPDNSIPKEAAFQIINDELMLDGNPRLNLASFVTTWMEPECDKLIVAAINKSYVDMNITFTMTKRGNLEGFHSPDSFYIYGHNSEGPLVPVHRVHDSLRLGSSGVDPLPSVVGTAEIISPTPAPGEAAGRRLRPQSPRASFVGPHRAAGFRVAVLAGLQLFRTTIRPQA